MSTKGKPRAVGQKKKKEVPVQPEPAPVPAQPEPVPVQAAPAVVEPAAAAAAPEPTPIVITSTSRVTANLNVNGINALLKERHSDLDDKIKAFEYARDCIAAGKVTDSREVEKTVDGAQTKVKETFERPITAEELAAFKKTVDQYSGQIASMKVDHHAYGAACLRFAKQTSNAIAITCDEMITQMVVHAMNVGKAEKRKNIDIDYMYRDGLESLPLAPLFKTLPTYVETRDRLNRERRAEADKANLDARLKEQEKTMKKQFKITKKMIKEAEAKAPVADQVAAPPADEEEEEADAHSPVDRTVSFNHYVGLLCKAASAQFPEEGMRATGKLREHLAKLLSEFCRRLCVLLAETVRANGGKTVKVNTALFVLKFLLVDGHKPVETVELVNVDIPDPNLVKKEEEKKAAEKAAGRSYKYDESKLPKVIGREAQFKTSYPTSGYDALEKTIFEKLKALKEEAKKVKK
jgi:hypothetical protein